MNNRALMLTLAFVFCVGILTFIYMQQQILNEEMSRIERPVFKSDPIEVKKPLKRKVARGALPKIDRANDPLAPVVMPKPEAKKSPTSNEAPKKIYEMPETNPILAQ